jgi:hypothetical protein
MEELKKLEKEKSLTVRLKKFVFGTKAPDFFSRIIFFLGLIGWTLSFLWSVAVFIATFFIDEIDHADKARAVFTRLGEKYGIEDFLQSFQMFTIVHMIALAFVLLALILIWRDKLFGFVVYFVGYGLAIFAMPIILNFEYMWKEVSTFDKILYIVMTLPVTILFLYKLAKRSKAKAKLVVKEVASEVVEKPEATTDVKAIEKTEE